MSKKLAAIVTGGRDYGDRDYMFRILDAVRPDVLIEGGANGADRIAQDWALEAGVENWRCRACWAAKGGAAGPIRNEQMLQMLLRFKHTHRVIVLAFPGGRGTAHMVRIAEAEGLDVQRLGW